MEIQEEKNTRNEGRSLAQMIEEIDKIENSNLTMKEIGQEIGRNINHSWNIENRNQINKEKIENLVQKKKCEV
jgi:hypothetical protein